MQLVRPAIFLNKYRAESMKITFLRTSTVVQLLTVNKKFARHFKVSRISVDKRFLCICLRNVLQNSVFT